MKTPNRWQLIISAVIAAALIALFVTDTLTYPELKLSDAVFQRPSQPDPRIIVVGIDDWTLAQLGRFQDWRRDVFADAINIMNSDPDYRPAVILLDVLFTETGLYPESDAALVEAARNAGNVITGGELRYGFDAAHGHNVVIDVIRPFPELAEVSVYGMVNGSIDSDGYVRHALLWDEFEGERLYSFAAQVYYMVNGYRAEFTVENREMYIPFYGLPGEFFQFSFSDLFEDWFDPAFFADSIVMVGAFTTGMMDMYLTPMSAEVQMHGVEIHANATQALLEHNFKLDVPQNIKLAGLILIMVPAFLATWFFGIRQATLLCAILAAGQFGLSVWLFEIGWVYMVFVPVLAVAVIYLFRILFGYFMAELEKQRVRDIFMKYVDPKLVNRLIETGEADSNQVGVMKDIAVMFVDVRGFTPMAEALKDSPDIVVQILNEYLELTSSAVFENGGSVDKFIGDATMALFNGFVPLEDYEYRAVKAAWDIVQGASRVNASIKEKYGVDVGFGVGVHCGGAIVGNLGPAFRKDYTAIGDTVNTAARLESSARRSQVLISKTVRDRLGDRIKAASIGAIPLKGKSEELEIFSVEGV